MSQPTLLSDRRERCPHCGAVMHTIKGVARHYGAEAACLRVRELEAAITDACIYLKSRDTNDWLLEKLGAVLAKGVPHAGS